MFSIVHATLENPAIGNLGNMESNEFFGSLMSTLISLMLVIGGILLLAMILKGAIDLITSGGDKIKTESARKTLTNAIIGVVILFSFFAIVNLIGCILGLNFFEIQVGEFNIGFSDNPLCESTSDGGGDLGCFTKNTKIKMSDGTEKNIEAVTVGDIVYSYDFSSDKIVSNTVVRTTTHPVTGHYLINGIIKVTGDHLMYLPDLQKWEKVENFKSGDFLIDSSGEKILIETNQYKKDPQTVYNFEVEFPHNYYANGILVHNAEKP